MQENLGKIRLRTILWKFPVPKLVVTSNEEKVNILWNQEVHIDRTTPNNELDIIIRDNVKGTCI
jgi:hypothetical protein